MKKMLQTKDLSIRAMFNTIVFAWKLFFCHEIETKEQTLSGYNQKGRCTIRGKVWQSNFESGIDLQHIYK